MAKRGANLPTTVLHEVQGDVVTDLVTVYDNFRKLEPCRKNNPEMLKERLDYYFRTCSENDLVPSVESLALCCNVSRTALFQWEKDSSSVAGMLIISAKNTINAIMTQLAFEGKINGIFAIWNQKNNFHYADSPQVFEIKNTSSDQVLIEEKLSESGLVWDSELNDFVEVNQ